MPTHQGPSRAILHLWLTTPIYATTHTHQHSQHYALAVSHIPTQHIVVHRCTCTFLYTKTHLCGMLAPELSTQAHTKLEHVPVLMHAHTNTQHTHAHAHMHTRTHTHTHTHKHAHS